MSHPVPSQDSSYPSDDYKPVRKAFKNVKSKKKSMAKKMSLIDEVRQAIKESEMLRKHPFDFKKSLPRGSNLPPGYHDRDNE